MARAHPACRLTIGLRPRGHARPDCLRKREQQSRRAAYRPERMSDDFLHLAGEDEADLDDESRQILEGVRHLCSLPESGLRTQNVSATREERHLRLRLQRSPEDWVDLLVGDGYTEFSRSDEK